ncbi:hypothetical protein PIB30_087158 [Stylosanthes scabra]|uniref:Uncharacterized protein n=1 Tax=Stylosanthes scabra TaxID=79078 RepID=A0ABU6VWI7_9FABA|nr:hypothetical protein [Stylosanthes scabra]
MRPYRRRLGTRLIFVDQHGDTHQMTLYRGRFSSTITSGLGPGPFQSVNVLKDLYQNIQENGRTLIGVMAVLGSLP